MKVTWTDMQNVSSVLAIATYTSGTIAESKKSIRAAKVCVVCGLASAVVSITGSILYLTGKIEF